MEEYKEDNSEECKQKYPNFYLADLFYTLQLSNLSLSERNEALLKLFEEIKKNNMYPYYSYVCGELNLDMDQEMYDTLKHKADEEMKEIENKIQEASENFDYVDTKNDMLLKANFYCKIGDKVRIFSFKNQINL
ncbi:hypothetical protein [Plasmodium yoelii yoelii]|uniref:26S proteasome regulatory subunit Rpn7 N-terminal domain-containing protein n=1 Tax=Plasmodium yoelii yoelii TaxID=73239 RepID=Q7R9D8_PLAYO|nr:hypothetical protein [Plasmodium yoelii yoelii]